MILSMVVKTFSGDTEGGLRNAGTGDDPISRSLLMMASTSWYVI